LLLGALATLAACSGGDDTANDAAGTSGSSDATTDVASSATTGAGGASATSTGAGGDAAGGAGGGCATPADATQCRDCVTGVTLSGDVQPILTASCAKTSCHSGATPKEGLDLRAGKSYADLVGVTSKQCSDGRLIVAPGDPGASYVMDKMLVTSLCEGKRMPPSIALSATKIRTIADWICEGAQDN
jgi:hypothetical protein